MRHELEAKRSVDHIVAFAGNVRRLDGATERQVVGHRARQPQPALTDLQLRYQVDRDRRPGRHDVIEPDRREHRAVLRAAPAKQISDVGVR